MGKGARQAATGVATPKRGPKNWKPKTWVQIAKLADEALAALHEGRQSQATELVRAIRGVALAADADGV